MLARCAIRFLGRFNCLLLTSWLLMGSGVVYTSLLTPLIACRVWFSSTLVAVLSRILLRKPVCCAYYLSRIAPLPPDTVAALDAADRVEFLRPNARLARSSSYTGHQACFRLCGPTEGTGAILICRNRSGLSVKELNLALRPVTGVP